MVEDVSIYNPRAVREPRRPYCVKARIESMTASAKSITGLVHALLDARLHPQAAGQSADPDPPTQGPKTSGPPAPCKKTEPSGVKPEKQAAEAARRQSGYHRVHGTHGPGIPPEDHGHTAINREPDPEGPEGGA